MVRVIVWAAIMVSAGAAAADAPSESGAAAASIADAHVSSPEAGEHVVYGELFGKGGLWGVGYDYRFGWLSAGAALSAYQIHGQRVLSLSPYVGAHTPIRGRHGGFAQLGPQLVDTKVISPVPQWSGERTTGLGGQLSVGYEYRGRVLVRGFVMVVGGKGGVAPWAGVSVGAAL